MKRVIDLRWAKTSRGSRIVHFSAEGERALRRVFSDVDSAAGA